MSEPAALRPSGAENDVGTLASARRILHHQACALETLAGHLGEEFVEAVRRIECCRGSVVVSGIGKAGLIGQKLSATFASTGSPSHFLHPAEALHGDLGTLRPDDVLLAISMSGRTTEVVDVARTVKSWGIPVVALTRSGQNPLGRLADVVLPLGDMTEACHLGLAPSTSTTAMLALGDALALVVSQRRGFGAEDFARYHPGGSLGKRLARVEDVMRPHDQCRIAPDDLTVRQVLVRVGRRGRRTGAVMLVDARQRLVGIFTDSDLARLLEENRDEALDLPVSQVMTSPPTTVPWGSRVAEAIEILAQRKLSELPVLDEQGHPVGLIDITDLLDSNHQTRQADATLRVVGDWDSVGQSED